MKDTTYVIHQGNKEEFRMMSQYGVKQTIIDEPLHNACWDANLASDGTLYFSACSEHANHEFAKLYKYDFATNKATQCFYTKDYLLKSDRYLRDSKFHTSINFKPDGKLIMVTHSTDKSPCHPAWLPYCFISNPWEGFPGGELFEYDPKTGKVELFGIPAPRETIYGAAYSKKDDAYYMLGWMRGHLYRFDCKTRKCEDKGQVSEYRSYRIMVGPDENLYFSTKSGFLMRYNIDTQKLENLNACLINDKEELGIDLPYCYMGPCIIGPDGNLYTTGNNTRFLSCYNIKTGEVTNVGSLFSADDFIDIHDGHSFVAGMDFDKDGVLWYSTMTFRAMEDEHYKAPAGFFRWDIFNGGKPEFLGLFGTKDRVQTYTCNLKIDKERDILYSASTNHSYGSPDIIAVDLKEYRKRMHERGPVCEDMLVYAPGYPEYHPFAEHWQDIKIKIANYAANFKPANIKPVRLWNLTDTMDDAAVKYLEFADNDTVVGYCGVENNYKFTIRNGKLADFTKTTEEKRLPEPQKRENMPFYPGRQWRRDVTCECQWKDGSVIVGTEDGFLAKVSADGSVCSLGPAISQGPVRAICSNPEKSVVYGVGGDAEDIGNIFMYTEIEGLTYLGYMCCDRGDDKVGVCANFILSAIAISPDGKRLAIGGADRLSSVYICDI